MSADHETMRRGEGETLKPGARVRAKQDLYQDADDELPAQDLCRKGDVLIVRRRCAVPAWDWQVSHPHRDPNGATFSVKSSEIELIEEVES